MYLQTQRRAIDLPQVRQGDLRDSPSWVDLTQWQVRRRVD